MKQKIRDLFLSGCAFYGLSSVWFEIYRSKYLDVASYMSMATSALPRPKGY